MSGSYESPAQLEDVLFFAATGQETTAPEFLLTSGLIITCGVVFHKLLKRNRLIKQERKQRHIEEVARWFEDQENEQGDESERRGPSEVKSSLYPEADAVSGIECFGLAQGALLSQIRLGLGEVRAHGPAAPVGPGGGPRQQLSVEHFYIDLDLNLIKWAKIDESPWVTQEFVETRWPEFGEFSKAFARIEFGYPTHRGGRFAGGRVLIGFRCEDDAKSFADAFGFWAGGPVSWVPERLLSNQAAQDDRLYKAAERRHFDQFGPY